MRPGGSVLVVERLLPERVAPGFDAERVTLLDIHMLVMFGSRERTAAEYGRLSTRGGFGAVRAASTRRPAGVVEARQERSDRRDHVAIGVVDGA
jgi:hypothetical protein